MSVNKPKNPMTFIATFLKSYCFILLVHTHPTSLSVESFATISFEHLFPAVIFVYVVVHLTLRVSV